jgi:phosphoglycolate phosphatase
MAQSRDKGDMPVSVEKVRLEHDNPMMTTPATVIFDLDGTLVDSAPDLTAALNHVLALEDLPPVSIATAKDMVGHGARKLMERGLVFHGRSPDPALIETRFADFMRFYGDNICVGSALFPGVREALEALQAGGALLGICTNKPEQLSRALIEAVGLTDFFRANLGADTLDVRKPHPRHLLETIARVGGEPLSSVMVGDSMTDIETAKAARVPVVAVSFGYTSVPPADFGADALIDHYDELHGALARAHASR